LRSIERNRSIFYGDRVNFIQARSIVGAIELNLFEKEQIVKKLTPYAFELWALPTLLAAYRSIQPDQIDDRSHSKCSAKINPLETIAETTGLTIEQLQQLQTPQNDA
jgi:hypothetical protein